MPNQKFNSITRLNWVGLPHIVIITQKSTVKSRELERHSVERIYRRQRSFDASKVQNHASLLRRAANNHAQYIHLYSPINGRKNAKQYMYVGFSRRNNIPRVAVHTISEKAIRFRHPDYDPDRAQKLISSSMSRHLSTRNISSRSIRAFLSNLANRQTDKQTDKRRQSHLPHPLSEINKIEYGTVWYSRV